jgi:hypothetical protein
MLLKVLGLEAQEPRKQDWLCCCAVAAFKPRGKLMWMDMWCVWTCIDLNDFSSYKLSVGGFVNVDLAAALNGQPLQLTVYDTKVCV